MKVEQEAGKVLCCLEVSNVGKFDGKEIIQCYISSPITDKEQPIKTLQSFKKIKIKKGQTKRIKLKLNKRNFSYWDVSSKSWKIKKGDHEILIGCSSDKILLRKKISW